MKFWYKFIFIPVFILALTGCGKDDDETTTTPDISIGDDKDGKVTQLQKHTIGKGIPIVIMGDGFVDKDIREGKYREATNKALESLFSRHPLKSLRDYFDVYEVTAVSENDFSAYWANHEDSTFNTAFNVGVAKETDGGLIVSELTPGDGLKIREYAQKAIDGDRIDDATIIVVVNDFSTEGVTTYSTYPATSEYMEVPKGRAIAYVNLMEFWDKSIDVGDFSRVFTNVLLHEFGHAFAKLADEYVSDERKWDDPESGKNSIIVWHNSGYNRNISPYSDVTKTPWADFAADSRYDFEKLGCYEGGEYQATGVYRATENSIMRAGMFNHYGFNVIARVMFYKRCMKIAYGDSWTFDYEDFVKFDLYKAKAESEEIQELIRKLSSGNSASKRLGATPRFVDSVIRSRAIKTTK